MILEVRRILSELRAFALAIDLAGSFFCWCNRITAKLVMPAL